MKSNVKVITVGAVTLALTVVLGALPYVFLVPLLFTCVTRDWKLTLFESLCFGVISLLYSLFMPATPVAATFVANPWIPIVPRLLAGLGCHGVYVAVKRCFKKQSKASIVVPVIVACAVGSVLNTALVVPCLMWRGGNIFGSFDTTRAVLLTETLISGVIELAVAVVVVPPVAITVGKALRLNDYLLKPNFITADTDAVIGAIPANSETVTEETAQDNSENKDTESEVK